MPALCYSALIKNRGRAPNAFGALTIQALPQP